MTTRKVVGNKEVISIQLTQIVYSFNAKHLSSRVVLGYRPTSIKRSWYAPNSECDEFK